MRLRDAVHLLAAKGLFANAQTNPAVDIRTITVRRSCGTPIEESTFLSRSTVFASNSTVTSAIEPSAYSSEPGNTGETSSVLATSDSTGDDTSTTSVGSLTSSSPPSQTNTIAISAACPQRNNEIITVPDGSQWIVYCAAEYTGTTIPSSYRRKRQATTADECLARCEDETACVGFTYWQSECTMFSVITGVKTASALAISARRASSQFSSSSIASEVQSSLYSTGSSSISPGAGNTTSSTTSTTGSFNVPGASSFSSSSAFGTTQSSSTDTTTQGSFGAGESSTNGGLSSTTSASSTAGNQSNTGTPSLGGTATTSTPRTSGSFAAFSTTSVSPVPTTTGSISNGSGSFSSTTSSVCVTATPSPISCPASNGTIYTPVGDCMGPDTSYVIACGVSYSGGGLTTAPDASDVQSCIASCSADDDCVAAAFDASSNTCYEQSSVALGNATVSPDIIFAYVVRAGRPGSASTTTSTNPTSSSSRSSVSGSFAIASSLTLSQSTASSSSSSTTLLNPTSVSSASGSFASTAIASPSASTQLDTTLSSSPTSRLSSSTSSLLPSGSFAFSSSSLSRELSPSLDLTTSTTSTTSTASSTSNASFNLAVSSTSSTSTASPTPNASFISAALSTSTASPTSSTLTSSTALSALTASSSSRASSSSAALTALTTSSTSATSITSTTSTTSTISSQFGSFLETSSSTSISAAASTAPTSSGTTISLSAGSFTPQESSTSTSFSPTSQSALTSSTQGTVSSTTSAASSNALITSTAPTSSRSSVDRCGSSSTNAAGLVFTTQCNYAYCDAAGAKDMQGQTATGTAATQTLDDCYAECTGPCLGIYFSLGGICLAITAQATPCAEIGATIVIGPMASPTSSVVSSGSSLSPSIITSSFTATSTIIPSSSTLTSTTQISSTSTSSSTSSMIISSSSLPRCGYTTNANSNVFTYCSGSTIWDGLGGFASATDAQGCVNACSSPCQAAYLHTGRCWTITNNPDTTRTGAVYAPYFAISTVRASSTTASSSVTSSSTTSSSTTSTSMTSSSTTSSSTTSSSTTSSSVTGSTLTSSSTSSISSPTITSPPASSSIGGCYITTNDFSNSFSVCPGTVWGPPVGSSFIVSNNAECLDYCTPPCQAAGVYDTTCFTAPTVSTSYVGDALLTYFAVSTVLPSVASTSSTSSPVPASTTTSSLSSTSSTLSTSTASTCSARTTAYPTTTPACNSGNQTIYQSPDGSLFRLDCGITYTGYDTDNYSGASINTCWQVCAARGTLCAGVVFNPANLAAGGITCYFKSSVPSSAALANTASINAMVRLTGGSYLASDVAPICDASDGDYYENSDGSLWQIQCGVDNTGTTLATYYGGSLQACIDRCDFGGNGCVGVSFTPNGGVSGYTGPVCILKSGTGVATSRSYLAHFATRARTAVYSQTVNPVNTCTPSATPTASVTPVCPGGNQTVWTAADGSTFRLDCSIDRPGSDIDEVGVTTYAQCAGVCAARGAACKAVSFVSNYEAVSQWPCWLKSAVPAGVQQSFQVDSVVRLTSGSGANIAGPAIDCPAYNGTVYSTSDGADFRVRCGYSLSSWQVLISYPAASFRICVDSCDAWGDACAAVIWDSGETTCALFSTGRGAVPSSSSLLLAVRQTWDNPTGL